MSKGKNHILGYLLVFIGISIIVLSSLIISTLPAPVEKETVFQLDLNEYNLEVGEFIIVDGVEYSLDGSIVSEIKVDSLKVNRDKKEKYLYNFTNLGASQKTLSFGWRTKIGEEYIKLNKNNLNETFEISNNKAYLQTSENQGNYIDFSDISSAFGSVYLSYDPYSRILTAISDQKLLNSGEVLEVDPLLGSTLYCTNCSDCSSQIQNADPGDTVILQNNISYNLGGSCIGFNNSDSITFDCDNHVINGNNFYDSPNAINIGNSNYINIRNCKVNNFFLGITSNSSNYNLSLRNIYINDSGDAIRLISGTQYYASMEDIRVTNCDGEGVRDGDGLSTEYLNLSTLNNISVSDCLDAMNFFGTFNSSFSNLTAINNGDGIRIGGITGEYNVFSDSFCSNNSGYGFELSGDENVVCNSTFENNGEGVYVNGGRYSRLYNCIFNNSANIVFEVGGVPLYMNYWNTTNSTGPNILGGLRIGGNYYANPSGTGYSQTCDNLNNDAFCDVSYDVYNDTEGCDSNNCDYLPLADHNGNFEYTYLETKAPIVYLLSPQPNHKISNDSLEVTFKFIDDSDSSCSCALYLDGNMMENATVQNNTNYSFTLNNLDVGYHRWNVKCTDKYGNIGTPTFVVSLDNNRICQSETIKGESWFNSLDDSYSKELPYIPLDGNLNYVSPDSNARFGFDLEGRIFTTIYSTSSLDNYGEFTRSAWGWHKYTIRKDEEGCTNCWERVYYNGSSRFNENPLIKQVIQDPTSDNIYSVIDGIYVSQDKGNNFEKISDLQFSSGISNALSFDSNGTLYACTSDSNGTYKSEDGVNFTNTSCGTCWFWSSIAVAPNGDIYRAESNDGIYKSTDGCDSEVEVYDYNAYYNSMYIAPNNYVYVTTEVGDIIRSSDNGSSWEYISINGSGRGYIHGDSNLDYLYIVNNEGVHRSEDLGDNWVLVSNCSDEDKAVGVIENAQRSFIVREWPQSGRLAEHTGFSPLRGNITGNKWSKNLGTTGASFVSQDIDGDGEAEIIVRGYNFTIFDGDSSIIFNGDCMGNVSSSADRLTYGCHGSSNFGVISNIILGDFDGDLNDEVFIRASRYRYNQTIVKNIRYGNDEYFIDLASISGNGRHNFLSCDLNEDGVDEIISIGDADILQVINGTNGYELWNYTKDDFGGDYLRAEGIPACGDIDGDREPEIIFVFLNSTSWVSTPFVAFEANGSLKWINTDYYFQDDQADPKYHITLGDVLGDSAKEPIISIGYSSGLGPSEVLGLIVFNGTSGEIIWRNSSIGSGSGERVVGSVSVADLDEDGKDEIVTPNGINIGGFSVFDNDGTLLWRNTSIGDVTGSPLIADLDSDNSLDIAIQSNQGLFIFDKDGNKLDEFDIPALDYAGSKLDMGNIMISDVDGDGSGELILLNSSGYLHVLESGELSGPQTIYCDNCSHCTYIINNVANPGDTVILQNNISNHNETCIHFNGTDNITFDCDDYLIDGDSITTGYGLVMEEDSDNNIIRNCNFEDFYNGVWISDSSNNEFSNISTISNSHNGFELWSTASSNLFLNINSSYNGYCGIETESNSDFSSLYLKNNGNGMLIDGGNGVNVSDVLTLSNSANGITLRISTNCILDNISSIGNGLNGIFFQSIFMLPSASSSNILRNSLIEDSGYFGLSLQDFGQFGSNNIYNNFFNNTLNINFSESIFLNYFNTTNSTGPNIIDGNRIGGNYYATPLGTGYSQTCDNLNNDSFCDNPYDLEINSSCSIATCSNNTDYLPLADHNTSAPSPPPPNECPDIPLLPNNPEDNETGVSLNPVLNVTVTDPDGDAIDVSFYNANGDVLIGTVFDVASGNDATFVWPNLNQNTIYYWYVSLDDDEGCIVDTSSDSWEFTTNASATTGDSPLSYHIDFISSYLNIFRSIL